MTLHRQEKYFLIVRYTRIIYGFKLDNIRRVRLKHNNNVPHTRTFPSTLIISWYLYDNIAAI